MIFDSMEQHPGARFLLVAALTVVVVHGLRFLAPILLPFFLALFLAVLSLPIMVWLRRNKVPASLAIFAAVMVQVAVFGLLIFLFLESLGDLQTQIPTYNQRLRELIGNSMGALEDRGIPASRYITPESINPGSVLDFLGGWLQRVASILSKAFLVLIIMIFILGEATVFPEKFRAISRRRGPFGEVLEPSEEGRITNMIREVQAYLGIKTLISLATGVLIGFWTYFLGLDFPVLLGLIAFLLNYVPTIGSVLAAFPGVLLSIIQFGDVSHAVIVVIGYLLVNLVFGNLIEPNVMGRRLGLSTLVVILSLLFWGWAWGPVGALLAVPLTQVVKIMLENTRDLRWIAVLLDKAPPPQGIRPGPADVDMEPGV